MALPPAARLPPSSVASMVTSMRGRPSMIDPVRAVAAVGRQRPVRRARRVDAGDVLDDDAGLAADDALHLEAQRALGAGRRTSPMACGDRRRRAARRSSVSRISSSSTPSARAIIRICPPHTMVGIAGRDHRRLVVHGLAHADEVSAPSRAGRRWSSRRSPGSGLRRWCRPRPLISSGRTSLPQPGSMPRDEQRAAALRRRPPAAGRVQLGRGVAVVVERVEARGHDDGAGAQRPWRCPRGPRPGRKLAGRRVGDGAAPSRSASAASASCVAATPSRATEVGQVAGVAADLVRVGDDDGRELETRVGVHGTDRRPAHVAGAPHDHSHGARRRRHVGPCEVERVRVFHTSRG